MTRQELEHVIRAACVVVDREDVWIVGSQAVLGVDRVPLGVLTESLEADVVFPDEPELAEVVDGTIGELSPFHDRFGYHAHGIHTDILVCHPAWRERAIRVQNANTRGTSGWCMHPVDIAVAKLAAGREKDLCWVTELLRSKLVSAQEIQALVESQEFPPASRAPVLLRLVRCTPR